MSFQRIYTNIQHGEISKHQIDTLKSFKGKNRLHANQNGIRFYNNLESNAFKTLLILANIDKQKPNLTLPSKIYKKPDKLPSDNRHEGQRPERRETNVVGPTTASAYSWGRVVSSKGRRN